MFLILLSKIIGPVVEGLKSHMALKLQVKVKV